MDSDIFEYRYRGVIVGIFLSMISGVLFTTNNFIINQLEVVVSDVVLVRCFIQIFIYTSIIICSGHSIFPENVKEKCFTISQGLVGSISFITSLASVSFMPVPDALCIIFSCPVVTMILSAVILGDKLNSLKCFSGFLLLLGDVLVCQPQFIFSGSDAKHAYLYYVGVALACAACCTGGLMNVLIAMCQSVSTPVLVNWSAISGLILAISFSLALPTGSQILSADIVNITREDWIILTGLGLSGLLAFTSLTQALKFISPSLVASIRATELVLAYTIQALLTGESPDLMSCAGGTIIVTGVLVLAFQDKISNSFLNGQMLPGQFYRTIPANTEYSRLYG